MYSTFHSFLSSLLRTRILTKNVFYVFVIIAIGFFVVMPLVSLAIEPGLVPCGLSKLHGFSAPQTDICTICDLFLLIQNLLNKSFTYFAMPIAALMLAFGGFTMVYQGVIGGSPQSIQKGQKIITNAAIGLLIVFSSWLIVDTILKAVGAFGPSSGFGPWNEIKCTAAPPIETSHKGCKDGQCTDVPGSGVARCTRTENCAEPPVHSGCVNQACKKDVPGSQADECTDDAQCITTGCSPKKLEAMFNYPQYAPSAEVNNLMFCIRDNIASIGVTMSQLGEISITDNSYINCNYTRGNKVPECGINKCSHVPYSCHYGGRTGKVGALAVDFGGDGGAGAFERDKGNELLNLIASKCGQYLKDARCEDGGGKRVPCREGMATHIHITTKSCDGN